MKTLELCVKVIQRARLVKIGPVHPHDSLLPEYAGYKRAFCNEMKSLPFFTQICDPPKLKVLPDAFVWWASLTLTSFVCICQVPNLINYQLQSQAPISDINSWLIRVLLIVDTLSWSRRSSSYPRYMSRFSNYVDLTQTHVHRSWCSLWHHTY